MKSITRSITCLALLLLLGWTANAQIVNPVKWEQKLENTGDNEYTLILTASIDDGWKIYANDIEPGGPIPTGITYDTIAGMEKAGELEQLGRKKGPKYDEQFEMDLKWFIGRAIFRQTFKLTSDAGEVKGFLSFMTCDDSRCLPPEDVFFHYSIENGEITNLEKGGKETSEESEAGATFSVEGSSEEEASADKSESGERVYKEPTALKAGQSEEEENKGLWGFLIAGLGSGLLALLTPCVFPMIPLTVSFFTKSSSTRKKGIANALIYAFSIIAIFLVLGFLITFLLGPSALNAMASNKYFNLIFFFVFIIFAMSFFGAFELTLPNSFINKADKMSDKGGLIGIFFMAFTLVLVSFSCTAPIVGSMLVLIADSGQFLAPLMGLLGFALALAIPFALFAAFPSWLNTLPKSGGWLNTVKVVLGFAELALALKFLSVADLAYHWNFLTRDIFIALWIIIAVLLGAYLIGKLRFPGEPEPKLTIPRLFFGIMAFAFGIYLIPGLWGAPVKLLSGIAPPQHYQEFQLGQLKYKLNNLENQIADLKKNGFTPEEQASEGEVNIAQIDHIPAEVLNVGECPHELDCYFDLSKGLEAAKREQKPILLDFTGWSCVNCRKMEDFVWSDPEVWETINNEFILVSLYVDDKSTLPKEFQQSQYTGNNVRTVGKLWSDLQQNWFNINSQPYYVLMDHNLNILVSPPKGYTPSVKKYHRYLKKGLEVYEEHQMAAK